MNINATLIGQSVSFIVFVWFCMKYVWPPVTKTLEERKKKIADGLIFAKEAVEKLTVAQAQADECILAAQQQAKSIIDQANQNAVLIVDEAKIRAQEEARRLHEKAQNDIAREIIQTKETLRKQTAALVAKGTSQVIGEYISAPVDQALIDKIITKL